MNHEKLQSMIIQTLAYFHIFKHPLTDFELWKFLFDEDNSSDKKRYTLCEIKKTLEELKTKNFIHEYNGFYSLYPGRIISTEEMVNERMRKARLSEAKYKKALRIIRILQNIPTIKMIGICNSLAFNNADRKSDIDLFIITEKKGLWFSRLITVGILKLLKLRPTPYNSQDKICASFFVSEEELNFADISIFKSPEEKDKFDIYLLYWLTTMVPIYNNSETYEKFVAENQWVKKFLPNWNLYVINRQRKINQKRNILFILFFLFEMIFPENLSRKFQLMIMPKALKKIANKDTRVIINDSMLKFHDKDRRGKIYESWEKLKKSLLNGFFRYGA